MHKPQKKLYPIFKMKGNTIELPTSSTKFVLPILTLVLITTLSLYSRNTSLSLLHTLELNINATATPLGSSLKHECNIFNGNWVPYDKGPYYTNETKCVIDDRQNCMKYGRPDTEFMKWRWKPDECELPLFDGVKFLELVKGKTMAFVGDSVGRNQMQSLVCLLASVSFQYQLTLACFDVHGVLIFFKKKNSNF